METPPQKPAEEAAPDPAPVLEATRRRLSIRWLGPGPYLYLSAALVLLAIMYPMLGHGLAGLAAWTLAFWGVLLVALHAIASHPHIRLLARVLAWIALLAGLAGLLCYGFMQTGHEWIFAVSDGLTLLFLLLATGVILGDVLLGESIDVDHLLGAACVYVLLGLTFAYVLPVLDVFTAEPVVRGAVGAAPDMAPGLVRAEYLYFSFVTLSTLGYGDLAPAALPARLMACVEAIMGQLFLTIFVARLVALHIARGRSAPPSVG